MTPDLRLSGSIPGLLRRGSPVYWRDEDTPYVVTVQAGDVVLAAPGSSPCLGVEDDASNFTLDMGDPTGRYHALRYVWSHGRDLRWLQTESEACEAQLLAWSVLAVEEGYPPIRDILRPWSPAKSFASRFARVRHLRSDDPVTRLTEPVLGVTWPPRGWVAQLPHEPFAHRGEAETLEAAMAAADAVALAACFALQNPDGSYTLPSLLRGARG